MAIEHLTREARQKAGQAVERDLIQFMIQYQPCHADVLLEIANAPLPAAHGAASREVGG